MIELFKDVAPRTVENFRCLCTGERGNGDSGSPLHFQGSCFHRIIAGFMVQGGDITHGTGMGGESIYGQTLEVLIRQDFVASVAFVLCHMCLICLPDLSQKCDLTPRSFSSS